MDSIPTTSPSATATRAAPSTYEAAPVAASGGSLGATYSLKSIAVGRHDGFTRVVWEMAEAEGAPYYEIVQQLLEGPRSSSETTNAAPVVASVGHDASAGSPGAAPAAPEDVAGAVADVVDAAPESEAAAALDLTLSDVYAFDMQGPLSVDGDERGSLIAVRPLPIMSDSHLRFAVYLRAPLEFIDVRVLEGPVRLVLDIPDE